MVVFASDFYFFSFHLVKSKMVVLVFHSGLLQPLMMLHRVYIQFVT